MTNQKSKITLTQEQIQDFTNIYNKHTQTKRIYNTYTTLENYLEHITILLNNSIDFEIEPDFETAYKNELQKQTTSDSSIRFSSNQKLERFVKHPLTKQQKYSIRKQILTNYIADIKSDLTLQKLQNQKPEQADPYYYTDIQTFTFHDSYYPLTIISAILNPTFEHHQTHQTKTIFLITTNNKYYYKILETEIQLDFKTTLDIYNLIFQLHATHNS